MKQQQAIAWMALVGVLAGACPAQVCLAQEAVVAGVRLAATRGTAEFLDGNGRWTRLKGPLTAAVGTAVRTAPGAELTATFTDGSTITLGATSAMRFTRLAQNGPAADIRLKVLGQLSASISPARVVSDTVAFDTPVGRATINKAFAVARAVRDDVASSIATLQLQTPTARAVRLAVSQGAATLQSFYNVSGVVTATDPEHGSFTLIDAATGKARRVVVGNVTLLSHADTTTAHAARSPRSIVQSLTARQNVVVYGEPVHVEGPGDEMAQADVGTVNATIIFPEGNDYLAAEDFVAGPDIAVVGAGVSATAGHTASLSAGSVAPAVTAGASLSSTVVSQVAVNTGVATGVGAAALSPVLIGAGVVVVGAAVVVVSNNNRGSGETAPPSTLTPVTLTLGRLLQQRPRGRALMTTSAPVVAGADILPSSGAPFLGSTVGPSLTVGSDGLTGKLQLGHHLQVHVGASFSGSGAESNVMQVDTGIDYLINSTHALGFGVQTRTFTLLDPVGNSTSMSTSTPQIRYTIRY